MNTQPIRGSKSFTLIELITVMAIIALLVGILMPALWGARQTAQKAQAKVMISSLSSALQAYYNEYGSLPVTSGGAVPGPDALDQDQRYRLFEILTGRDVTMDGTMAGANPRRITFVSSYKAADISVPAVGVTNFTDPWKRAYQLTFDHDGDNQTRTWDWANATPTLKTALSGIWSEGPDKTSVTNVYNDAFNTDNIASWN